MSELRRLLEDDGDDLVREMLDSAKDDVPDAAAKAKTLGAIAGGLGAATAATVAKPATATTGLFGLAPWKWLAILALGAIGTAALLSRQGSPPASSGVSPPAPVTTAPAKPAAEPPPAIADAPRAPAPSASEPRAPGVEVAAPSVAAVTPSVKKPAATGSVDPRASASAAPRVGLAEETAMLDEARRTLASGDAQGALAVLDRYDREARQRMLGPEATMVRIEALHARGDDASARALAKKLLASNPGAAYEDRVRTMLGEVGAPSP